MPATTQSAAALVSGQRSPMQEPIEVLLLRAICIGGKRIEPGVLQVERSLAAQLIGARKAERIEPKAAQAVETPPPAEPQQSGRRGRSRE